MSCGPLAERRLVSQGAQALMTWVSEVLIQVFLAQGTQSGRLKLWLWPSQDTRPWVGWFPGASRPIDILSSPFLSQTVAQTVAQDGGPDSHLTLQERTVFCTMHIVQIVKTTNIKDWWKSFEREPTSLTRAYWFDTCKCMHKIHHPH